MHYGEIISLGRHRLMCGDATNRDDVMRLLGEEKIDLVLTDPPYGINIFYGKGGKIGGGCHHATLRDVRCLKAYVHKEFKDDSREPAKNFYHIAETLTDKLIFWGGSYFTDFLPVSGGWIFWDKNRRNMDFSDGELAWKSWGNKIKYYKQTWNGVCMEGSYKLNGRKERARLHPTQ